MHGNDEGEIADGDLVLPHDREDYEQARASRHATSPPFGLTPFIGTEASPDGEEHRKRGTGGGKWRTRGGGVPCLSQSDILCGAGENPEGDEAGAATATRSGKPNDATASSKRPQVAFDRLVSAFFRVKKKSVSKKEILKNPENPRVKNRTAEQES